MGRDTYRHIESAFAVIMFGAALLIVLEMVVPAVAVSWAQETKARVTSGVHSTDIGGLIYQEHCAPCHGEAGKGDGPVAATLKEPPADLTILAKKNKGVFPTRKVEGLIEETEVVTAHGTKKMPIWGMVFGLRRVKGEDHGPSESSAQAAYRIKRLVTYLKSIQEK